LAVALIRVDAMRGEGEEKKRERNPVRKEKVEVQTELQVGRA